MKKKNLFITQVINSIKNFDWYKEVSKHKISNSFIYFFILILIYAVVVTIGVTYSTKKYITEAQNFVINDIKSLNYLDGTLSINDDVYSSYYGNYIIVDTSGEADLDSYNANIVIGKKEVCINMDNFSSKLPYEKFFSENFDKNMLVETLRADKYTAFIIVFSFFGAIIVLSISTLLDILVIAIIGFIISNIIGNNKIEFKNVFNMAVHAITLSVVLSMIYCLVNTYTGFYVKYFSTMYTLLASIYMATAVILVNAEENNKK